MNNFSGYRVFALVNTVVISCVFFLGLFMWSISYHDPKNTISDNVVAFLMCSVLMASIVGGWNLSHEAKFKWSKAVNWFLAMLPWTALIVWILGENLYYEYLYSY